MTASSPFLSMAPSPAPIHAQIRKRAEAKVAALNRKLLRDATIEMVAHMDDENIAEIYEEELPTELRCAWTQIWDSLDFQRELETVSFTFKGRIYWLTR